ncbi:MAG: peptidylprolyl isomerase [Bacillota bacterium]|nr:peptidylprolyl isomerase [Bacillota bacterium]MDW7683055.1 peptidylprolyl isomerase [Bacillota bacterium]
MTCKRGKIITVFAVVLTVVMILLAGCGSTGNTVAEVNGEKITRDQLESYLNVNRLFDSSMEQMFGSEEGKAEIEKFYLEEMIQFTLLKELAGEKGIEVTEEETQEFFEHIQTQLVMMLGSEEELASEMERLKISEEDFVAPIHSLLFQDALIAHYADELNESDVSSYVESDPLTGVSLDISHILVESEEEALEAQQRLADGEEFTDLAKEISTCPSSEAGGDLGLIEANTTQYDQDFMAGARELDVDQVSEPVQTQFGWHLILVTGRTEPDLDQVRQMLATQELGEEFNALKEQADIKNNLQ